MLQTSAATGVDPFSAIILVHDSARAVSRAILRHPALSLAGTNLLFYQAIQRIPQGVALTQEFLGPFSVARQTSGIAGKMTGMSRLRRMP